MNQERRNLVVLVADSNAESTVCGLLLRPQALGIRPVRFDVYVHVARDPGCFKTGHDFLRPMTNRYTHGLVLFDRIGSGQDRRTRESLEESVRARLAASGWDDRAEVIVLDPELEIWVWADSTHVDHCLGWHGRQPSLRAWLFSQGLWSENDPKPSDPKAALEQALRLVRKPRSSSLYKRLAERVSLRSCQDPSFVKFKRTLRNWFPEN